MWQMLIQKRHYSSLTWKWPSSCDLSKHVMPVQFELHGSPFSQLLKFLIGSIRLLLITLKAVTAKWIKKSISKALESSLHVVEWHIRFGSPKNDQSRYDYQTLRERPATIFMQIDIIVNSLYAKFGKFMKLIGTLI